MMELTFYQAECGDATKIIFKGNDQKLHYIFIDSGYVRTFRNNIKKDIEELIQKDHYIDLWIVSHIHDDHIGGVKKYIDYIQTGELKDIVKNWMYNPPRFYEINLNTDFSNAKSIKQGDVLYNYLASNNKTSKLDFINDLPPIDLFGMKIILLSPSKKNILDLREKYEISKNLPLEVIENDEISNAVSIIKNDYHNNINEFQLDNFIEDDNIENGSSISFIIEYNGKNYLWLADVHPSIIVETLKKLGYTHSKKLNCELVKVSHHGSKKNNSNELYDLLNCSNYIFTSNGENKPKLPNKETIARILRNKYRNIHQEYNLYFNYDNNTLRNIFANENEIIYDELNFKVFFSNEKKLKLYF